MEPSPSAEGRGALQCSALSTPIGAIYVEADHHSIRRVSFVAAGVVADGLTRPEDPHCYDHLQECLRQLQEYFSGVRRNFDLPIEIDGTEFQRHVWQQLIAIPFGETRTYAEVAAAVGRPRAVRAVGQANHVNRWMILVPCHRVIGAGGNLTGFAAGLPVKERLLAHERQSFEPDLFMH